MMTELDRINMLDSSIRERWTAVPADEQSPELGRINVHGPRGLALQLVRTPTEPYIDEATDTLCVSVYGAMSGYDHDNADSYATAYWCMRKQRWEFADVISTFFHSSGDRADSHCVLGTHMHWHRDVVRAWKQKCLPNWAGDKQNANAAKKIVGAALERAGKTSYKLSSKMYDFTDLARAKSLRIRIDEVVPPWSHDNNGAEYTKFAEPLKGHGWFFLGS